MDLHHITYISIFLWFCILEQLTPIPEEISLMTLGYIVLHQHMDIFLCSLCAIGGLLTADFLFFHITLLGRYILAGTQRWMHPSRMQQLTQKIKTHPIKTIVLMCMIPKLRFLSPVLAAAADIPLKIYFPVNALAILSYATLYIFLGVLFKSQLEIIFHQISLIQHGIFILLMGILSWFIFRKLRKQFKKAAV